jgi:hypothetical protein
VAVPKQLVGGVNIVVSGPRLKNSDTGGTNDGVVVGIDEEDKDGAESVPGEGAAVLLLLTNAWARTTAVPVTRNCSRIIAMDCNK